MSSGKKNSGEVPGADGGGGGGKRAALHAHSGRSQNVPNFFCQGKKSIREILKEPYTFGASPV